MGERVCTADRTWSGCACPCDGIWCDGECVAYQTDVYNCGRCGFACAAGDICRNGDCLVDAPVNPCAEGLFPCEEGCVNLDADPDNCGSCGFACENQCMCMLGSCGDGACGSPGRVHGAPCEPAEGIGCKPGLVCYGAQAGSGRCLFSCDSTITTCSDFGSCMPFEGGGICFAAGDVELGEACGVTSQGCRPGLDCITQDDPFHGTCEARCECETGAGCGVDDPDYTCIRQDAESQRCWCGRSG